MSTPALERSRKTDVFAVAAELLSMLRPVRSRQLQQAESDLDNNRADRAEESLREHLAKRANDPDALYLMARAQLRLGRPGAALALLRRCLDLAPDFAVARFNYADLLHSTKEYGEALQEIDVLLTTDRRNPLFRRLKADILTSLGVSDETVRIREELVDDNPQHAAIWIDYGHALRATGQHAKSVAAYRKAIELRPSSGKAYWALANMKTVRFSDGDIEAMNEQLRRMDAAEEDRIQLQYALGKAYEDRGEYDRSFEHYAKGNAAMRIRVPYNADNVSQLVKDSKAIFTPEFLAGRKDSGCKDNSPIFVVSLPRSGSTLIEQILSSHSQIEGAGELPYITALIKDLEECEKARGTRYTDVLKALDPAALKEFGEQYLGRARTHLKLGRPFFVDKKPPNWFHVGLIHLILPNAKMVDVRRHPAACCFSQFRQFFRKPRPRQAELGRLYRDYVEMMAHFDRVLPGKIHRVIYEELVTNPEDEVRRLLEYLELPFEENCLRFYETQRAVTTPSSEQVRKPISRDAVEHWRNFEPWLGPLIESLGSVFTEYPSVPQELR
ncbi:MAG: tetratricopeptide repeat-containing sulfotransferase family protein [Alphaproteobacteria bacterium]